MKIQRMDENIEWKPEMFRELTPEELKEAYALMRADFTADDLQKFTEIVEDVDAEQVLADMEEAQKQFDQGTK
jgi:hypothetical protein